MPRDSLLFDQRIPFVSLFNVRAANWFILFIVARCSSDNDLTSIAVHLIMMPLAHWKTALTPGLPLLHVVFLSVVVGAACSGTTRAETVRGLLSHLAIGISVTVVVPASYLRGRLFHHSGDRVGPHG